MRNAASLMGITLVLSALALLAMLLYDATALVALIGLDPIGNEAVVVLIGLALVAVALTFGVRCLRGSSSSSTGVNAG